MKKQPESCQQAPEPAHRRSFARFDLLCGLCVLAVAILSICWLLNKVISNG